MSSKTLKTVINDHKYTYTQLSARQSLLLKFELAGIIGKVAGELATVLGKSDEEQMASFANAMTTVFKDNKPEKILTLIETIFVPAFRDGERVDIDKHYKGEFGEMYQALFWVLKEEYGSFLGDAQSIL